MVLTPKSCHKYPSALVQEGFPLASIGLGLSEISSLLQLQNPHDFSIIIIQSVARWDKDGNPGVITPGLSLSVMGKCSKIIKTYCNEVPILYPVMEKQLICR